MSQMDYFPSYPISFSLELTYLCSNSCPLCSNIWSMDRHKIISNWKFLLDKIFPENNRNKYAETIRITGGEPTLHPDFISIITYIDTFDIPFVIFSNGKWNDSNLIIENLIQLKNLVGLLISLHGIDAFTHNKFTRGNKKDYNTICDNIKRATDSGLTIFTNTIITKYVCAQVGEIIDFSKTLGASCAVFNRLIGHNSNLEPDRKKLRNTIIDIDSLKNQGVTCQIGNCVPQCFIRNSSYGANSGIEHCVISPEGLVRPNNHTDVVFGNIFEQSITEIWTSKIAEKYRLQISKECLKCKLVNRCRGGIKLNNEDGFLIDPLMRKAITTEEDVNFEFDPNIIPIPFYKIRKTEKNYIACRYNWSMPFPKYIKDIYIAIDGKTSLYDLHKKHGDTLLNIIGHLYQNDFIGFNTKDPK